MVVGNLIKVGTYYDSISLMQTAKSMRHFPGVHDVSLVMGTDANKSILRNSSLATENLDGARSDDLVIAISAEDDTKLQAALKQATQHLKNTRSGSDHADEEQRPHSIDEAIKKRPNSNLVLISVSGQYSANLAEQSLRSGLNVFMFSDNVSLADELRIKQEAQLKGLIVMGPDAGTAMIQGVPLGFANACKRGPVGLVAASGTGLQAVMCALDASGVGISQALGTGGRDLKEEIGGISMLTGLKALQEDPQTQVIVLISKPPAESVTEKILSQVEQSRKPTVLCFLGGHASSHLSQVFVVSDLTSAAETTIAIVHEIPITEIARKTETELLSLEKQADLIVTTLTPSQRYIRGLYTGGTFCYEAQLILNSLVKGVYSNTPTKTSLLLSDIHHSCEHTLIDLGDDEFTNGRLHPMMDPSLRNRRIVQEALDPSTAVIVLDFVLGFGSHPNPCGDALEAIQEAHRIAKDSHRRLSIIAYVCGTESDEQDIKKQKRILQSCGVLVLQSNAACTKLAGFVAAKSAQRNRT